MSITNQVSKEFEYKIDVEERIISIPTLSRSKISRIVSEIIEQTNITAIELSEFTINFIK